MAAFNFPNTTGQPTDGSFTYQPDGSQPYYWNGTTWQLMGGTGGGASIEIDSSPPDNPGEGDLWWNTNDGKLYVYYIQPNQQAQWVEASPSGQFQGGLVDNSIIHPERLITDLYFDLSTGPYWTCGAIDIPNPVNAQSGMGGLIRFTEAPTSWGSNFSTPPTMSTFPCIVPFYIESDLMIRLGAAVGVA